ncbi:MAG: DegV family protein [Erysipelotrichaceae bacterium]|nr:DegV family protein [Erysipelotrichaceae bacterium]
MKTAFVTDSAACFNMDYFAAENIFSLPLQISVNDKNYFDLEQLSVAEALAFMKEDAWMTTSQPALGLIDALFDKLKEEGFERVVAVPITSGISGTINAMYVAGQNAGIPVTCIDCYTTAYYQKEIVEYLSRCEKAGMDLDAEIAYVKSEIASDTCNTFVIPRDLKTIRRSGRLTPAAYHIANLLGIKPLLAINHRSNGRIDILQKVRTFPRTLQRALEVMQQEIDPSRHYLIAVTHIDNFADAEIFADKVRRIFPNAEVFTAPLCTPVAVHVGIGGICIQYFPRFNKNED